jgi:hypothetical protein
MGRVTSRYAARDQERDGNFDRGAVKSNQISQELLQDLPRGESRIQLLPDKRQWQNWGYNLGLVPYSGQGSYNTDGLTARRPATTPMRYSQWPKKCGRNQGSRAWDDG